MIKSSSKNGIRVEKDIELVMKNTGNTPWYDYLVQYIILVAISISIFYCLASGLSLEVDNKAAVMVLGIMVAYFIALFSFQSIFKYTGIITLFLYVMFGYINLEHLQTGYAQVYNTFIELYNDYFNASAGTAIVPDSSYLNGRQFFLLFLMVIIVAVVCYTGMYGKSMFVYLVVTGPMVYLSLIVGYTPALRPYLIYIIGTVALFVGSIVEKYGLFSKANRMTVGQFVIHTLEKARVKAQVVSVVGLTILFSIIYFWYSPERYEKEFNAKEIRTDFQEKMKEITSSDLLKGTLLNRLTEQFESESSSGMSNGRLGKVSNIKYNHTTALRVITEQSKLNKNLYLKGFVGETYAGDSWRQLSKMDQTKVDSLNASMVSGTNVELLSQKLLDLYTMGLYPYYSVERFNINVENVSADSSYSYIPYNSLNQYQLYDGKIQLMDEENSYLMFEMPENQSGHTYYEDFLKYAKFSAFLQLNIQNKKVIEDNLGKPIRDLEQGEVSLGHLSALNNLKKVSLESLDSTVPENDTTTVGFVGNTTGMDPFDVFREIIEYEDFAQDENRYFDLVRQIYTKLPQAGLERVKELVKDRKVDFKRTLTEDYYDKMDQVDTTEYAKALYKKYEENLKIDLNEIGSDKFSYDKLTNQDKIFEAVSFVKDYLGRNTKYTLSPGSTPEDKDYVENFLFDKKKGYCMHYASAATVMLRAMGVPARYVEGYVVTEEDFQKAQAVDTSSCEKYNFDGYTKQTEKSVQIDVQDTNAHAWVEVYLPGFGWTPVEMTSPYSDNGNIEVPPVNKDPKATLKPTKKPTATPKATASSTTKPTNAAASQSKTSSSGSSTSFLQGIKNWYEGLSNAMQRTIQVVVILILLILGSLLIILVRRRVLCLLFEKGMKKRASKDRILYVYREMARLTSKQMPEYTTNVPYGEYAKSFVASYPFINEQDAEVYFSILLKAKFGMAGISPEEEKVAMEFYESFIKTLEEGFTAYRRLYYKYLFVLRR